MVLDEQPPKTKPIADVLALYNIEHGTNLTFVQLGAQLAKKELEAFNRKTLRAAIVEEVLI